MLALCCVSHFVTHLGPARFDHAAWWLAAATISMAFVTLFQVRVATILVLATVQVLHTLADAPFNPDHWLLLAFVHLSMLLAATHLWIRHGRVDEQQLYDFTAAAARPIFLICYGYATLAKYNTHFLGPASSCGTELARIQLQVSPWLGTLVRPQLAGAVTVVCESFVFLLLLTPRFRRYGILVGLLFHTALVLSPAIAVFDFSITVYTMLLFFTPSNFVEVLGERTRELRTTFRNLRRGIGPVLAIAWLLMLARSCLGQSMYENPALNRWVWLLNMLVASLVIGLSCLALFGKTYRTPVHVLPQLRWHYVIFFLALVNGWCPYMGLKTQGSFTMFSNLRTEGDHWNHLFIPRSVRVFDDFQDDLWQLAQIDDRRLQRDFVDGAHLVPGFEIRRAVAKNPEMALTVIREGDVVRLDPARLDPALREPPRWWALKLLIFRPVTPDGSAYCGN